MGRPPGPPLNAFGDVLEARPTATAGRNRLGFGEADQHDLAIVPAREAGTLGLYDSGYAADWAF
jgi:hypothetical protein